MIERKGERRRNERREKGIEHVMCMASVKSHIKKYEEQ
jgi:hypothetical protein